MIFKAVLCIALVVSFSDALPSGAPSTACSKMAPSHGGTSAQPNPNSPFLVSTQNLGDKIIVEISSPTNTPFRGLFLQVRTHEDGEALGFWTLPSGSFQVKNCHNNVGNALTHTSNEDKFFPLFFEWTPPSLSGTTYQVHATIVQDYANYWVKLPSGQFTI